MGNYLQVRDTTMAPLQVRDGNGVRLSICTSFLEGSYYCGLDNALDNNRTDSFNFSVEFYVSAVQVRTAISR